MGASVLAPGGADAGETREGGAQVLVLDPGDGSDKVGVGRPGRPVFGRLGAGGGLLRDPAMGQCLSLIPT